MRCSSHRAPAATTSSHLVPLTDTSSPSSVTSAFFELHKPNTSSPIITDVQQPLHGLLPWRQHPGSSLSPAAFIEYIRLINLRNFDKVASESPAGGVWPAAEIDGTTSRSGALPDDVPSSVVRPAAVKPTPLQPLSAASQPRHSDRVESTPSLTVPSPGSFVDPALWRPGLRPPGRRVPVAPLRCGLNVSQSDSFLPPPSMLFPVPPPSLPLSSATPGRTPSTSSNEFAPWSPRNCAGLLSAVMHRQVVAAVAAATAEKRSSFQATGSSITVPSQRQFDVLNPSRLPGPSPRLSTPPSAGAKRLFSCPQCRYLTDRKNNLKRHVSTMHHESDKQLECCAIVFKSKASLRDHVLIFHGTGYQCRHCGRNFCRKALLKRHLTVHSGQKDYICGRCDYATSHKSNLERHKKVSACVMILVISILLQL